ncbi:phospholipase A2 homolog otoconin-22-like [Hyperolius riggenbachi]|uniref:phospholipase A2 homolog otoconin-22-like n=1 Tax=Hyperolius riggenbachi TaxID=752182 RepID=UPI0035A36120
MAKGLIIGLAVSCIIALVTSAPAQFDEMIKVTTIIYDLANFSDYGCHCGANSAGRPVDAIDWCCHERACCHNEAELRGCNPVTQIYRFYIEEEQKVKCLKPRDRCEKMVCECDEKAANCFRKELEDYNAYFRNITALGICRGPRPFC